MTKQTWLDRLFVSDADVYRRVLEKMSEAAGPEIDFVARRLDFHEVPPGSRVLDLACGVGRHTIELAERGYRVTGVDMSPTFIERAEELADEAGVGDATDFVVGDMRTVADDLRDEQFDAVVNLFSSFGFYDDQTNQGVLEQCLRLVRPDGIFMLDTLNRDWLMQNFQPHGVQDHGELLTVEDRDFDLERGVSESHWTILERTDPSTWEMALEVDVAIRIFTLNELIDLFEDAGWFYVESFGSLTGDAFELGSKRLVGVFKAP